MSWALSWDESNTGGKTVTDKPHHFHCDVDCEILKYLLADVNRLDVWFNTERDLEVQKQQAL